MKEKEEKIDNKNGLLTMTMLTIGSMVGAGILITPGLVMSYGFAGILGWFISAFCALSLSRIFALNAVSAHEAQTLGKSANTVFGRSVGFRVSMIQCLYMSLAVAFVTKTMMLYLRNFITISTDYASETCVSIILLTIMISIVINFSAAFVSVFATFVKLGFFSTTSIIGLMTLKRAKLFGIRSVSNLAQRCHMEFIALISGLALIMGAVILLRGRKLQNAVLTITAMLAIFMICNNFDLLKKAIYLENRTLSYTVFQAIKAASATMFAFAGLEFASADPSNAVDPKVNIPKSAAISIIVASLVFIATHLCCVNNIDMSKEGQLAKPVQSALANFANDVMTYFCFRQEFKCIAIKGLEQLISIIAIIGCLGTCLAIILCVSNIFYDALKEVVPDANKFMPQNNLKVRPTAVLIVSGIIALFIWALYYIKPLLGSMLDFCILYTYFYVVLIALKNGVDPRLGFIGLAGCILLASGCDAKGVFVVSLFGFMVDAMFIALSMQSEATTINLLKKDIKEK